VSSRGAHSPRPDAARDRGRARGQGLEPLLADAAHDALVEVPRHALREPRAQGVHATLERGDVRPLGRAQVVGRQGAVQGIVDTVGHGSPGG
jgi:hypothetical protein